jgi:hypothetical protein
VAEVVRELAAKLSLQTDKASFRAGDAAITSTKQSLQGIPDAAMAVKAALVGVVGYGMKKAFIDFNSEIEQSVIALAAVQKMFKGTEWGASMETATKLVDHYQEVAKKSVGETRDFIFMHKSVAAAAYQAGASLEDVKKITEGAVVAASAMGESAYLSSMDIKQALTKGVEIRDRFMIQLLAAKDNFGAITKEQFNAMSKLQRVEVLKKKLQSDWIKDAAKQMEFSFAGVVSTLKDTLNITMGKIGLPLFKAITTEIIKWNQWMEKNPNNVFFELAGRAISEATAGFKVLMYSVGGAVSMLQMFNKEIDRIKRLAGDQSGIVKVFEAITNPLKEAYETLRDIIDFMSGEASALGLQMATARGQGKEYMLHAQKGGKFDKLGRIVPIGQKPETPVDVVKKTAEGMFGGTATAQALTDAGAAFRRGDADTGIIASLGAVAGLPLSFVQGLGSAASMGMGAIGRPKSPWADIPYDTNAKVSPESLTSSMPGPWAFSPPPPLASGIGTPEPVKMTGEMKVNIKVEAVADTKMVSEDHSTELRASGALYSSEP